MVVDDELLSEQLGEPGREQPVREICGRTRRKRRHDPHRPYGLGPGARRGGNAAAQEYAGSEQGAVSTHGVREE